MLSQLPVTIIHVAKFIICIIIIIIIIIMHLWLWWCLRSEEVHKRATIYTFSLVWDPPYPSNRRFLHCMYQLGSEHRTSRYIIVDILGSLSSSWVSITALYYPLLQLYKIGSHKGTILAYKINSNVSFFRLRARKTKSLWLLILSPFQILFDGQCGMFKEILKG